MLLLVPSHMRGYKACPVLLLCKGLTPTVVCCPCAACAELASSQHQQTQLQREVKQLQALAAEKDEHLSDAAAAGARLRQQLDRAKLALQEHGAGSVLDHCAVLLSHMVP